MKSSIELKKPNVTGPPLQLTCYDKAIFVQTEHLYFSDKFIQGFHSGRQWRVIIKVWQKLIESWFDNKLLAKMSP